MEKEGKEEMDEAIRFIEQRREASGKPISSSELLGYFLERNEGDIAPSISDTAIFLKFMARSDPETAKASHTSFNKNWFQTNIADEYGGSSYSESLKDGSTINLIGKPYHSWSLVALLPFFPIELIHAAGVYRQLSTLKSQGISKSKADLQTLQDLRATEAVCLKYQ